MRYSGKIFDVLSQVYLGFALAVLLKGGLTLWSAFPSTAASVPCSVQASECATTDKTMKVQPMHSCCTPKLRAL